MQHEPEMQELKKHQNKLSIVAGKEVMKFKVLLIPAMLTQQLPPEQQGNLGPQLKLVNKLPWRLNVSQ